MLRSSGCCLDRCDRCPSLSLRTAQWRPNTFAGFCSRHFGQDCSPWQRTIPDLQWAHRPASQSIRTGLIIPVILRACRPGSLRVFDPCGGSARDQPKPRAHHFPQESHRWGDLVSPRDEPDPQQLSQHPRIYGVCFDLGIANSL